jgi:3-methyladenine DNA glycosylase Mpg
MTSATKSVLIQAVLPQLVPELIMSYKLNHPFQKLKNGPTKVLQN